MDTRKEDFIDCLQINNVCCHVMYLWFGSNDNQTFSPPFNLIVTKDIKIKMRNTLLNVIKKKKCANKKMFIIIL